MFAFLLAGFLDYLFFADITYRDNHFQNKKNDPGLFLIALQTKAIRLS